MFESFRFSRRRAWQGTGRPRPPQSSQARRPGTRLVLEPLEARRGHRNLIHHRNRPSLFFRAPKLRGVRTGRIGG